MKRDSYRAMRARISTWWLRWGSWTLAILYVVVFFTLSVLKHDSLHTRAFDLAKFDQAAWNTLHGRFLFSTLDNQSILANHFSPLMAVLSPLFLIWNDVRMMFLAQVVGLALAGLLLSRIVRSRFPELAPWFLLLFYLNPALHDITLIEVRRVTLAVPLLALAIYGLHFHKRKWLVVGLGLSLLCKENIAIFVFMVGFFLTVFERDRKWGASLMAVGAAWAVVVAVWVIPSFVQSADANSTLYPQLSIFCIEGSSYREIAANILAHPQVLLGRVFDRTGMLALFRVFLPVGFVLPFLAPTWLLLVLPEMAYMLMSCGEGMHSLHEWYMASVLPGLFAAVAVALTRFSKRTAHWVMAGLLVAAVAGYVAFSPAPLGGQYSAELYQVNEHARLAAQIMESIPADARVAAQDPYVPHLSHRQYIYLFPWISGQMRRIDYFLLDRRLHSYPLQPTEMNDVIDEMIADPSLVIEREADDIYLFHQRGEPLPTLPVDAQFGEGMRLDRVDIAVLQNDDSFRTVTQEPIELRSGQTLRASLYWEATSVVERDRTVSIRVADASGEPMAQQDNMPARGTKPTSSWTEGQEIRDVYYLTVVPQALAGPATLDVVVYDSVTGENVTTRDGSQILHLCKILLRP
jgi:uncharacterized membrane protein